MPETTRLRRSERAAHYRRQAARLREMAEDEGDEPFRRSLGKLARQYEELAENLGRS